MSNKLQYCQRILKTYSLLVDYSGEVNRTNVPAPLEKNETFQSWKKRVLGGEAGDVVVYLATAPRGNTTIKSLKDISGTKHIEQVLRSVAKGEKEKTKEKYEDEIDAAVDKTKEETAKIYKSISVDTLKDLVKESEFLLEPSVTEFFERYFKDSSKEVDTVELLRDLLSAYNTAVRNARHANLK